MRKTLLLLLLLLLSCLCAANAEVCRCSDDTTFTREQAWSCCINVVDTNHDGAIDAQEIEQAKSAYLYWYERSLGWIVGPTRVSAIMHECDGNADYRIDAADFEARKCTCMPYMDPYAAVPNTPIDALCRLKSFCDRAANVLRRPVYE